MAERKKIILVSTGLGRVRRGFETYINDLANLLHNTTDKPAEVLVYGGGNQQQPYPFRQIWSIYRDSKLALALKKTSSKRNRFERLTFFWGMIPWLLVDRPKVVYLGEYAIYCWLYRLRYLPGFNYNLCLYTGGFAVPGLFNPKKDFIHHITNEYWDQTAHYPRHRQFLLPHFIDTNFTVDFELVKKLKLLAGGKATVLCIGAIEATYKRMDWFAQAAAKCRQPVFPIIMGEPTAESPAIVQMLTQSFGTHGFLTGSVPRKELGSYYTAADLFVLCTKKESFGLVMLEAMFFGLPVVGSDNNIARFVLQDNAILIDMQTPETVALAIDSAIENRMDGKAESRKAFVGNNYSIGALKSKYIDMFKKITV